MQQATHSGAKFEKVETIIFLSLSVLFIKKINKYFKIMLKKINNVFSCHVLKKGLNIEDIC